MIVILSLHGSRIDKYLCKNSDQQGLLLLAREFLKIVSLCMLLVNLLVNLPCFFDMRSQIQLPSGEQLDCFVGNLGRGGMSLD